MSQIRLQAAQRLDQALEEEQERLELLLDALSDLEEQVSFLDKEKDKLEKEGKKMEKLVDLGMEMMYCRAEVNDADCMFVDIGGGVFVQVTLAEARQIVQRRKSASEENIREIFERRATIQVEIQILQETLGALGG